MRRGSISLGEITCEQCQRIVPHSERYLVTNEEDGVEVEQGKTTYYCVECALQKGYAYSKEEKGETIITFFPEPDY